MAIDLDCCPKHTQTNFPKNIIIIPGKRQFLNPGNFANLHKKVKGITPRCFDGIQFGIQKQFDTNKSISANWVLSRTYPTGFRIGGIYETKCSEDILTTPRLEGDFNPSTLATNLSFIYNPLESLKLEGKFQICRKCKVSENLISLEYLRNSSTYSLTARNVSCDSGSLTLSYLESLNMNLSAGLEILCDWSKNCDLLTNITLGARYRLENSILATTFSSKSLEVSYWRKVHKAIQMGYSLVFEKSTQKALGSIYYQWEFKDAFVRGKLDTDWTVGVMYNRNLSNPSCTLGLNLLYSIPKYKFGFGLTFDVNPSFIGYL